MNGRYLFDTNAIIALLKGNFELGNLTQESSWIGISVIAEVEFLSFSNLSPDDDALFKILKSRITVVSLDSLNIDLIQKIIEIRRVFNVKLPDAIIAGSAIVEKSTLVTNDHVFSKITGLKVKNFNL